MVGINTSMGSGDVLSVSGTSSFTDNLNTDGIITVDQDVGGGVDSPEYDLDIDGTMRITSMAGLIIGQGGSGKISTSYDSTVFGTGLTLYDDSKASAIYFKGSSVESVLYADVNYISVGHTSTPVYMLDVASHISTPILYDKDDSSYYMDPAGTSQVLNYTISGVLQAQVFYDSDNTSFYIDPRSTSQINNLNLANNISAPSADLASLTMTSTGSSYADDEVSEVIDKDNTSYGADFNGDSTFYNLTLSDTESSKISDSDNSNYYVDPNDTSVFNVIEGNGTVPIGGIITWSGAESAIPDGWALCDGSTVNSYQTPDLRTFIMGAGSTYSVSIREEVIQLL